MRGAAGGQSDGMRRYLIPTLAALLAAAASATLAGAHRHPSSSHRGGAYSIGLWGDVPYSDTQKTTGVPNLVADMNGRRLAFTVNDGDLKSGGSACTDDVYLAFKATLNSLRAPAAFTPGDNDWTDCDRGPFSSSERLDFERRLFFATPFTLGQRRLRQEVQDPPYVENRRWTFGRVTYATLNVQGSCNNLCDVGPDPAEYAARNRADIAWLRATFAAAKARGSAAVMLVYQADPGWDQSDPTRAPLRDPKTLAQTDGQPDGFQELLSALRDETIAFRRPVVAVNGDSHYFRIDKPLQDAEGRRVENFTRVETFGDHPENGNNDVHWLQVDVDPRSREVFSYQPQIVPANRTAVPAP
jgi:hypothetical protein